MSTIEDKIKAVKSFLHRRPSSTLGGLSVMFAEEIDKVQSQLDALNGELSSLKATLKAIDYLKTEPETPNHHEGRNNHAGNRTANTGDE